MINDYLINPKNIVIVGGSNDIKKPGGKIVKNIIDGDFLGDIFIVNHKETTVQGRHCFKSVSDLVKVDLAIIAVPARFCVPIVKILAEEKGTKAFIVLSAGFSEAGIDGKKWEEEIVKIVNEHEGCLIGPNCIGVLNLNYKGVFTLPIPKLSKNGCDLISSSGATAVFLMEAGMPLGLKFNNVYSLGNSAQVGVEEVLEYMDVNFNPERDSKIKLLYLEYVSKPKKLIKHASSLISKGVRIAAIKAGSTEDGSRAAASHTGAITNSDMIVRAMFQKAGIVYCSSREELLSVASIFTYKELKGKRIAVITHAGGSAVMLTDALSKGGLSVPKIEGHDADKLLSFLHQGSSVSNPIDFLATGTADQLGIIIDYCEHKFDDIDAMIVVFGSPGLFDVKNVYDVLSVKLEVCKKPIFPVLPSVINAQNEIEGFLSNGYINFPDEVVLGRGLTAVYNTASPTEPYESQIEINKSLIRSIIERCDDGFLTPEDTILLLDAAGIERVIEFYASSEQELEDILWKIDFPIVMKVVGPIHKSDVGGVKLNVRNIDDAKRYLKILLEIDDATGVLVQQMISGIELFAGVKRESEDTHIVLCGLGGIFIEVLNDVSSCLVPISPKESDQMIKSLKGYQLIEGVRGQKGINQAKFMGIIERLSLLVQAAPEIIEMDLNPLLADIENVVAVDARIRIEK